MKFNILNQRIKNTIKTRYKYNKKILTILNQLIESNTEIRFTQLLYNLGIIGTEEDTFYEEPMITYTKIIQRRTKGK